LANATFEQRRELLLLQIDRVIVTGAEVEIRYVLPTSSESEHVRFCQLHKDYFHHPTIALEPRTARDATACDTHRDAALGEHGGIWSGRVVV
jgi:hypothetical protein